MQCNLVYLSITLSRTRKRYTRTGESVKHAREGTASCIVSMYIHTGKSPIYKQLCLVIHAMHASSRILHPDPGGSSTVIHSRPQERANFFKKS